MSWENTSCPLPVVPSQLAELGPRYGVKPVAMGECGASHGANTDTTTIKPRIISPARALPLPHSVRSTRLANSSGPGRARAAAPVAPGPTPDGRPGPGPWAPGGGSEGMTVTGPPGSL